MIKALKLTNFRNFKKKEFEFDEGVTVINAPNAQGKTNILESIFVLSTGKSFKTKIDEESINYDTEVAHVLAETEDTKLGVILTRGVINIGKSQPERVAKKKLTVNGISRRMIDFAGNLKTVLFLPEDLDLVTGTPTQRRKFLDVVLSQVDREYRRAIGSYEKGVRQRNKLLFRIREEGLSRSHLLFWNQLLIKNGNYITEKREELIQFINNTNNLNTNYKLEYDRSIISEGRLEQYKNEEVAAATTLVGPHRDDFIFQANSEQRTAYRELASYGSRGEQRMAVLWLKLAESAFVENKTGEKPTILLDDIFSELDHEHRKIIMDLMNNHQALPASRQVIITSADPHNLEGLKDKNVKTINL